jgi:hypothetical protein
MPHLAALPRLGAVHDQAPGADRELTVGISPLGGIPESFRPRPGLSAMIHVLSTLTSPGQNGPDNTLAVIVATVMLAAGNCRSRP